MMARDSGTALSKMRPTKGTRRKLPTAAMALEEDDHCADLHGQHMPPAAAGAASVWTEDMHTSFMNNMEAAFVHGILFRWPNNPAASPANHHHQNQRFAAPSLPRLDRYMPDSAESTCDGRRAAGDGLPCSTSAHEMKRSMWRNRRTYTGCTTDISALGHGGKSMGFTIHIPPKLPNDGNDDCDQVVPLFHVPQDSTPTSDGGGSSKRRRS